MIKRLFDPKHIPKLIAFGRKWHERVGLKQPYSPQRCEALLKHAMMPGDFAVWGAFDGKHIVGVLVGTVEPYAYTEGSYCTDVVFVAEKHGEKLLRALMQWGKSHGACAMQMGVSSGLPQAELFYEKFGLKRVGGIYTSELVENVQ